LMDFLNEIFLISSVMKNSERIASKCVIALYLRTILGDMHGRPPPPALIPWCALP